MEYAKAAPDDILIRITVFNRGPETATLHVLPTIWFRNTWRWAGQAAKPELRRGASPGLIELDEPYYGRRRLYCKGEPELLFTDNETNCEAVWGSPSPWPFAKDGIGEYVVRGNRNSVNPEGRGTKAAAHHILALDGGKSAVVELRLTDAGPTDTSVTDAGATDPFGAGFSADFHQDGWTRPTTSMPR